MYYQDYDIVSIMFFNAVSVNYSLRENTFSEELKQSEVIPSYKKLDSRKKENYRSVWWPRVAIVKFKNEN